MIPVRFGPKFTTVGNTTVRSAEVSSVDVHAADGRVAVGLVLSRDLDPEEVAKLDADDVTVILPGAAVAAWLRTIDPEALAARMAVAGFSRHPATIALEELISLAEGSP